MTVDCLSVRAPSPNAVLGRNSQSTFLEKQFLPKRLPGAGELIMDVLFIVHGARIAEGELPRQNEGQTRHRHSVAGRIVELQTEEGIRS